MTRLLLCLLASLAPALSGQIVLSGTNYTQNFDGIGGGLPNGFTTRTVCTTTSNGFSITPVLSPSPWSSLTGNFYNYASATGLIETSSSTDQNNSLNRCIGIRQSGSFGDAGSASPSPPCFLFVIQDTLGFAGFSMSLDLMMLSVQPRSTTWTVEYRIGSTAAFTPIGTYSDPGSWGTTAFNYNFGSTLDNVAQEVQIRVSALSPSTGSGNRDSFGIDNFVLNYSQVPAPTISAVTPATGSTAGGTSVTISGTNLSGATSVTFGGAAATNVVATAASITCLTPPGAAGAVNVSVTTPAGTAVAVGAFTYGAAPALSGLSPALGPTAGGTSVTINGSNLGGATSVTFGGAAGAVTSNTSTQIVVLTPARPAGLADVSVTTASGTSTLTGAFEFVAPPTLSGIAPATGPDTGQTVVTLSGTNLATTSGVTFDGTPATNLTASGSSITCTTPSHVAGAVNVAVTTAGGTVLLTSAFTYTPSGNPVFELREGAGGATLADGSPVTTGGYRDFDDYDIAGIGLSRAFVVQNNGSASLTLSAVTLTSGTPHFGLTATGLPAAIPAGGTYTFNVLFTPSSVGAKSAAIQLSHSDSAKPSPFTLYVAGRGMQLLAGLSLSNGALADAILGSPYSVNLNATGGTAPYTFQVLTGTLPPGLNLSQAGLIAGTPTGTATGPYAFSVRVIDSVNNYNNVNLQITVRASPLIDGGDGGGGGGCSSDDQGAGILAALAVLCLAALAARRMRQDFTGARHD